MPQFVYTLEAAKAGQPVDVVPGRSVKELIQFQNEVMAKMRELTSRDEDENPAYTFPDVSQI
jgi:hypothetical protein